MFSLISNWWEKRHQSKKKLGMTEGEVLISWDQTGVAVIFPSGERHGLAWKDINCVAIETNDGGPSSSDVWWLLESQDLRVAYPQDAAGSDSLMTELPKRFPGFSYGAVISAMGSTENARFVCWERKPQT